MSGYDDWMGSNIRVRDCDASDKDSQWKWVLPDAMVLCCWLGLILTWAVPGECAATFYCIQVAPACQLDASAAAFILTIVAMLTSHALY